MKPKFSFIETLAAWVISGFVLAAAVCFCEQKAMAQTVETQQTNPGKTITKEELDKIPNAPRDPSKLILPKSPPPAPTVLLGAAPGFSANIKNPTGLNTIMFTTPGNERLEVYLPNHLSAGSDFTATMKLVPKDGGATNVFDKYALQIEGQPIPLANGTFSGRFNDQSMDSTRLLLVDKSGKQLTGVNLPVFYKATPSGVVTLPRSGTAGGLFTVDCPCNGIIGTADYVKIGGLEMQLLASAPGSVVVLNNNTSPGLTEIETNIAGQITRQEFRNLTLKLSADKLQLLKGETTIVHIVVGGLEKLKAPAKMTIEASGVVTMGGGNSQKIYIDPSAVSADGTYTTAQTLVANSAGTFGVDVTVIVDEKK